MNRLTDEKLAFFLESLQGTCQDFKQVFDQVADYYEWGFEFDDLNVVEEQLLCNRLDDKLFECGECGWWCETGDWIDQKEYAGHEICSSCGEYSENNKDYEAD